MKKLGIVVVVLLLCVAGWAGATYIVGGQAQNHYFRLVEEYRQFGPVSITGKTYERGLTRSRAETTLEVTFPKVEDVETGALATETVQLVFAHTIHHGPLASGPGPEGRVTFAPALALVETRLVSVSPLDEELETLLADVPELDASVALARIGFDGRTDGLLQVPAFTKQVDEAQIRWGGLSVVTEYAPGPKTLVGSIDMPSMSVSTNGGAMTWDGMRGEYDLREALPLLYVGTSKIVYGALDVDFPTAAGEEQGQLRMAGLDATSVSRFDGTMVHYDQAMTFNGLTVDGETYGPLVIELQASNLDGQVLSDFQQRMMDYYKMTETYDPERMAADLLPMYGEVMTRLLAGEPEMKIRRLHLDTPMGTADGTLHLKVAGLPDAGMEDPAENPFAVLQYLPYLDAAVDVSADESLVRAAMSESLRSKMESDLELVRELAPEMAYSDEEIDALVAQQVDQQLAMLVAQEFIVREGGKLRSQATFNNGELQVNGLPVPLFRGR